MAKRRNQKSTVPPATVDEALADLLRTMRDTWEELDPDGLSAVQEEALGLLVSRGLVEMRASFKLAIVGQPMGLEAAIHFTGVEGIAEAGGPVVRAAWTLWGAGYETSGSAPEGRPVVHCERGPQSVRLTREGVQAREDLAGGKEKMVLDFIHARTVVFAGTVVGGHGRAEKLRTVAASTEPVKVEVVDAGPVAAIARAVQKMLAAAADKPQPNPVATKVATDLFVVTEKTLRRAIRDGRLRSYPTSSGRHRVLLGDVAAFWPRRKPRE